jgi:hypothetical protein
MTKLTRPSKIALPALDSQQVARLLWRRYATANTGQITQIAKKIQEGE